MAVRSCTDYSPEMIPWERPNFQSSCCPRLRICVIRGIQSTTEAIRPFLHITRAHGVRSWLVLSADWFRATDWHTYCQECTCSVRETVPLCGKLAAGVYGSAPSAAGELLNDRCHSQREQRAAARKSSEGAIAMETKQTIGNRDARKTALNERLENIGWGLFLIVVGATWLEPGVDVPLVSG